MRAPIVALSIAAVLFAAGCTAPQTPAPPTDTGAPPPPKPPLAVLATPVGNFSKIICDDGGCLRRMTTLETGPANEVMVAMDYANPKVLIAGSKDYHADDPTCVVVSVYSSIDGGRSWKDGYPRPRVGQLGGPSTDRCESDPAIAFDGKGNALLMTLDTSIGLFTYRTSDNGSTWKEVEMAFKGGNDKNWAASDFRTGRIYSITRATCNNGEAITYTDDAGESWRGPFCFGSGKMDFGQVDVGPDGTVYAIGRGMGGISFAKSVDGGENWTEPKLIARAAALSTLAGEHPYRTPALPDMAVAWETGWVYAVWHDQKTQGDQDVFFTYSTDKGETWKEPMQLGKAASPLATDQFIPAVAASPKGDAHVIWFDTRNDPGGTGNSLDAYYAHVPLGAHRPAFFDSQVKEHRLTPQSFVPYLARHQQQPFFVGDYIGLAATNNEAVAVFPVTINGRSEIHAAIIGD